MCGIAGKLYFDRTRKIEKGLILKIIRPLDHRGPDDEGVFVDKNIGLGFRRLSIIDLTSAAHQPMSNEDGSIWLVFNGEIYNFIDLRSALQGKGHLFRSRCDSEVVIHAYEEYGTDCVAAFNGMFAFAIWDRKRQQLFCGRDRTGEKPFFYYSDDEKFLFGSELKSLLAGGELEREIDLAALNAYFSYMYIPDPHSIFKGMKKLPAAHTLLCRDGAIVIRKYWDVDYSDRPPRKEREYVEELRHLLADAVKIRMVSDVPLGVFLSGGIDSSSVTALASGVSSDRVKTFSVSGGSGIFDELPYARVVAKRFDTNHSELNAEPEDVKTLLPKLIKFIDEPFGDSSIIPTYSVSKLARQKVAVALSGEGGDEVFGGYPWYKKNLLVERFRRILPFPPLRRLFEKTLSTAFFIPRAYRRHPIPYLRRLTAMSRLSLLPEGNCYESIMRFFPDYLRTDILEEGSRLPESESFVNDAYTANAASHCLDKSLYADLKTYLPGDLLTKVDRMSMANSLEVRAPFLDHRLIEFGARVPARLKIKDGVTKYILRRTMGDILPAEIIGRRDKRGFNVPVNDWFRNELRDFSHDILLDPLTMRRGIFSEDGVRQTLSLHQSRNYDYGHHIWSMIAFELWAREYI